MECKALGDTVLVMLEVLEEKSAGGIILAKDTLERDKSMAQIGTIVDIGPLVVIHKGEVDGKDTFVSVGDKVVFTRYAGMLSPIQPDKTKTYRIMKEDDIHGLVLE